MTDVRKLVAPHLKVTMDDASTWEVQATNRDLVAWDRTRIRQRPPWPKMDDAPFLWMTFLAWSASRREGLTTMDYETFEGQCVSAEALDDNDDDEDGPGTPTQPGLGPG